MNDTLVADGLAGHADPSSGFAPACRRVGIAPSKRLSGTRGIVEEMLLPPALLTISRLSHNGTIRGRSVADQKIDEAVYDVLDSMIGGYSVPPGSKGRIYRVIDHLRNQPEDGNQLHLAERISIILHQIERALRERDQTACDVGRAELRTLAAAWIQWRVSGSRGRGVEGAARAHPLANA